MTTAISPDVDTGANPDLPVTPRIVAPPPSLQPMSARDGRGSGKWIDYTSHPAYRDFMTGIGIGARLAALRIFTRNFTLILFKRLISYELIPAHLRKPRTVTGWLRLLQCAAQHVGKRFTPPKTYFGNAGAMVQDRLSTDGICVLQIDPAQYVKLQNLALPQYETLRRRRGQRTTNLREFEESRAYAMRTSEAALFDQVESILQSSGAMEGVSAYLRRQASLIDVNPQINDVTDDFWRHIFPDLDDADRPARYLHRDASGGDIKAIIYMSDVGPSNGPFSYVLGSHQTSGSTVGNWIEEANDQGPLSGTNRESRRVFAALPRALQRKCSCGNDVQPGTAIAKRMLGGEWTITASRGHIVLFDTKGLHRGGLVGQGERVVMTCVMG